MSKLITRAVVAGATLACFACRKGDKPADEPKHPSVGANTVVVAPQAFTEVFGAIGTVVGRAGHVATLMAPAAGRVGQVFVTAGQRVKVDQPLVELDQAPFLSAVQSADAALNAAQRSNERKQRLAGEGIIPKQDAEQSAAEEAKARADAITARRAEQLSVLKSPISGVVTRMSATLGASVDATQPLVEVVDPTTLDVLLSVTPTDAARVQPGAKVALSAGQTASGEPLGIGSVVDVSSIVDSTTRSVAVRVQAPTTRRPLRIGETIFGSIAVATRPAAIVIPVEALVPEGDQYKVFVVDQNSVAHEREVKVGGKTSTTVEITEGLKAGERVVAFGAYGMLDSAKVVPLSAAAADSGKADSAGTSEAASKSDKAAAKTDKAPAKTDKAPPVKP